MTSLSSLHPSSPGTPDWDKLLQGIILDRGSSHALHSQLRNGLRFIILHSLKNGERLLPELEMVQRLNLSQGTVRRALTELATEGLLERRRAIGTVVCHPLTAGLRQLAVVLPEFSSLFSTAILSSLQLRCQQLGIALQIIRIGPSDHLQAVERNFGFSPDDGAVVALAAPDPVIRSLHQRMSDRGYRLLCLGKHLENYPGSQISLCNASAMTMGLDRLTELGHRRILFLVGEPEEDDVVKARCRLFEQQAKERGLTEARVFHCGSHNWENGAQAVAQAMPSVWNSPSRPTAIFAVSDICAMGALNWLQQQGVDVPGAVSIVGFDGTDLTRYSFPTISTLVQPLERYAEAAIEILENPSRVRQSLFLPPTYREAGTTAPLAVALAA
ncbi:LacI family transcriptional regulator [Verrucomicrobium sp. GAS474]|uniref:substrate-binding domain-containing protein n=1 Tax=Verrucomicrobium sp. GAS474 TaxID=1882831 RepID=UPI00087C2ED3|nr:GntR family transcriptional regulator [Verrucomicrobium sp. GAS474]SDU11769.1 LacI family transcriptional regulator [Verrucomicrobium sp. GAS474]